MSQQLQTSDVDAIETQEWVEALAAVIEHEGVGRAHFLLEQLIDKARRSGANLPFSANTAYVNTIPTHLEAELPGDQAIEDRIRSYIRWNAMAMVVKANRKSSELGGHIATFASAATLYDIGFNHFWHAPTADHGGDLIFFQGHASPGMYSRAFLEGRLTEEQLDNFRQEVDGKGLSSYPHPHLMNDFWQFPTVSMGLGPIMSIYQARFMKYLQHRGLTNTETRKVWAFIGDGETDEPESLGAISLAGREKLDNLVWVVNCNLQRLDGPVRGNGKIVQELEANFRGTGWNVIKVLWGSYWDPLLAMDKDGLLQQRMMECVDGDFQNYKSKDGAFVRKHFFNTPELKAMVAKMSDEDIWRLNHGGHDPHKVYAAYHAAVNTIGQPTVILAQTVKGYGMGSAGEAQNRTHSQKKLQDNEMLDFRDRFNIPLNDEDAAAGQYYVPDADGEEMQYMNARRAELGGPLPVRSTQAAPLEIPPLSIFDAMLAGSGDKEMSTTMAWVRMLTLLCRDKNIGKNVVPIVPDEARTFGMEGMFRQLGIYSSVGQLYTPQDKDQIMFYKEDKSGQILEEGINEAGSMSSWIAAATAYSSHGVNMIPFYIYYSMFGFQRIGDLAWAAGDMQARGFMIGGTAGRTTLAGEGLQHQDGHSLILSGTIPNCISYDPTFSYEMAVIIHDGMRRMFAEQENVFYYVTAMNENYVHPAMPEGAEAGIIKGLYKFRTVENSKATTVQLMGSGAILREVIAAADLLRDDWAVDADIWSVTSFTELARDARDCDRWNRLHPTDEARVPYITQCFDGQTGPVIAATDYVQLYADKVRKWIPARYEVLGTDGFGRSDTRAQLRKHFEVNAVHIVVTALKALADEGGIDAVTVAEAIDKYGIDPEKINPLHA